MFRPKKLLFLALSGIILLSFTLSLVTPNTGLETNSIDSNQIIPNSASTTTDNVFVQKLTRSYTVDNYGLVYIKDQYNILNNQSSALLNFQFCISDEEASGLCYYSAENQGSSSLAIRRLPNKLNNYQALEVIFNDPILPYKSNNITIQLVLKDMLGYYPSQNYYLIDLDLIPVLPYTLVNYQTTVNLPSGSTQIEYSNGGSTESVSKEFGTNNTQDPFARLPNRCTYVNSQTPILKLTNVDRIIEINPLGYIRIIEKHYLQSFGVPQVYTFSLRAPEDAYNVTAKDDIGKISDVAFASVKNGDKTKNITFTLYGTATSNRAILRYGTIFFYQLEYYLPFEDVYSNSISKNNIIIDRFTTKSDFIILEQTTTLKIIGAIKITRSNFELPKQVLSENSLSISFKEKDVTKYHNFYLDLSYQNNFFLLFSRALIYTALIVGFLSVYIYRKTVQKPDEEGEGLIEKAIPVRELRQFVTLYEERNAIQLDMEKVDEDLIKRKIQKKAYSKTMKTYQDKVKQIDEEIRPFKKELMVSVEKITSVIQQLDYLEAERLSVKDSITLLQDRYKKGKLPSRAAYDRLSGDLLKRIEELQRKIDRNINELRAYLI